MQRRNMEIAEEEGRVIEILVSHEKTRNAYGQPTLAVGQAMGWDTATTLEMVKDLEGRNLVVRKMDGFKSLEGGEPMPTLKSWWERASQ